MAEENLKTKGTEVEEETGFWNRLNIPLPGRKFEDERDGSGRGNRLLEPAEYSVAGIPLHSGFFYLP